MEYAKPEVVAQNSAAGSYAAGCPSENRSTDRDRYDCLNCERTE